MAGQGLEQTRYPGVYRVHRRGCDFRDEARCGCPQSYQASVYSARDRKSIRKHFDTLAAARGWRNDAEGAVKQGRMRPRTNTTVRDAGDALIAGMRDETIIDRSGKPYKPSTIRGYERVLRLRVLPELGHLRLASLERRDVQALVDQMRADGLGASTVQNTLNPLQVICRRALRDGEIAIDPTDGLELPAVRGRRDKIASPAEAAALIAALPTEERALWATAFYAGLRRGELRALRWADVDLDAGVIHVRRSWDDDPEVGEIDVKSDAGRRRVPLVGTLRDLIVQHGLLVPRAGGDLVFGRSAELPFIPSTTRRRALNAWKAANDEAAKHAQEEGRDVRPEEILRPLTPHDARHCAASYLIAAGLNPKQLSVYIGHSDIRTTYNRYGHLMPGDEVQATARLDAFFDAARGV
jgi:integrase